MAMTFSTGNSETRRLVLRLDSDDPLDVRSFVVRERISSLFTVSVVAVSDNPAIDFDAVVGRASRFTVLNGIHERSWSGICSHIQQIGVEERGLSTYEITLVPELWFATQRRNYRIFQQISELDILLKLLGEWGVAPELRVSDVYKKRDYRVQYAESDYAFMSRMLEDAGISFYFAEEGGESRLVLSDAPHLNEPREQKLPFKDDVSMATGEYATRLRIGQRVRPGRYTMRDHDFRQPSTNQPSSSAEAANAEIERRLERFHYAPGAFLFGTAKGEGSPVADGRGKSRTDEAEGAILARKRLEAKRSSAKSCSFETNAMDLAPGMVLSFLDHPRPDLGAEHRWLVVEATHTGTVSGSWSHEIEVRSARVAYRPPLATPKPKVTGAESAMVVGAPGEEIHTDEFGRVRVHFHWDRESRMDDASSCWIHASQPWGGSGFGGMNLPRVGQEVLVEFLGGDPDRPVIVGRVYTGLQKVPFKLPDNKTQSGWRSASSPGGGGYNEIMFEDKKGKELLNIQAERDLQKLVKHDEEVTVGHDRAVLVQNDEELTVGNDRSKRVQMNEREVVGMNRTRVVGVNESVEVGAAQSLDVGAGQRVTVGAEQSVKVGAEQHVKVGASQSVAVGSNQNVKVGGSHALTVAVASAETVGLTKALTVGGAYQISVGAAMNTTVMGISAEEVGLTKSVMVGQKFEITCGKAKIVLEKSGKITLEGTELAFKSSGPVDVAAGTTLKVEATAHAELKGGTVQIWGEPIDLN